MFPLFAGSVLLLGVPHFDASPFLFNQVLAQKIVSLFLLSRQLLSAQQHYDWGLRALKPILTLAGRLLQDATFVKPTFAPGAFLQKGT